MLTLLIVVRIARRRRACAGPDLVNAGDLPPSKTTIPIAIPTTRSLTSTSRRCNTNLRLPKGKMAFRLTHRFLRTLGDGDFGDLARALFGFDCGAQIGLDLKYGLFRGRDRSASIARPIAPSSSGPATT